MPKRENLIKVAEPRIQKINPHTKIFGRGGKHPLQGFSVGVNIKKRRKK